MKRAWLLIGTCGLLIAVGLSPVLAATGFAATSGVTVSPALQQLTVNPGQQSAGFSAQITNHGSKTVVVDLTTNDFTALNQNGGVSFYTGHYNSAANPHGLAYTMQPTETQVSLSPGQTTAVPVAINNINAMAAGGHYGAVIYTVRYPATGGISAQVSNNEVLSSLIFLNTAGRGTQTLHFGQLLLSSLYFHAPASVQFVLGNAGNTQTTPRGYVRIENAAGKVVAQGAVNQDSGLVLPGSARLFSTNLLSAPRSFFGGNYRLVIAYRPDNATRFSTYQKSFFVIGPFWLWAAAVLLAVTYLLFRRRRKPAKK
jgi:hypothetical protein